MDGYLVTHACEAATDLERHLEEASRAHLTVKALFKSVFETVEMHRKFREFLFIGGKKSLLEFFELELLEPEDLVLMFSVPLPRVDLGTSISRAMLARLKPLARRAMKEESFGESCIGFVSIEDSVSVFVWLLHIFRTIVTWGVGQKPSDPQFL